MSREERLKRLREAKFEVEAAVKPVAAPVEAAAEIVKYAINTAQPILVKQLPDKTLRLLFTDVDGVNREFPLNVVSGVDADGVPRAFLLDGEGHGQVDVKSLPDADVKRVRWGIPREPAWINGDDKTAPTTTTDLVAKTVGAGKTGRIFGWQIISPEANEFILNIGAKAYRIGALAGAGVICVSLSNPIFDNITEGTVINIRVATAGGAGKVYRVDLQYDEA